MLAHLSFLRLLLLVLLSAATSALAFNFTTPLTQCSNVTISWGAGGTPPFELLLVPTGHLVPETRTIINYQNITSTTGSFSFPLTFPAGSSFVAVLSDAKYGPGSGGTSDILTVQSSPTHDSKCLATAQVKPEFYFYLEPALPSQCEVWDITWPKSLASDPTTKLDDGISIWAIVPGQATFAVPLPSSPTPDSDDPSLDCDKWTVDLAAGTKVMLVAGYEPGSIPAGASRPVVNGRGKGGSTDILTVGQGGANGASCLSQDPPATTLFPTGTTTSTASTLSSGGTTASTTTTSGSPIGATSGGNGGAMSRMSSLSLHAMTSVFVGLFVIALFGIIGL